MQRRTTPPCGRKGTFPYLEKFVRGASASPLLALTDPRDSSGWRRAVVSRYHWAVPETHRTTCLAMPISFSFQCRPDADATPRPR
ncbi:hypothetical protein BVI2075_350068 [Burkholderia vietnamiensis]|nr:hypothetical protein BVI2075_350068 [Burkholderia vietnamiensis]